MFVSLPACALRCWVAVAAAAICAMLALVPAQAANQAEVPAGNHTITSLAISNDQPIQIESDSLQISDKHRVATFTGHVKAVQGTTTLRAGKMVVHYASDDGNIGNGNSRIERIDVTGKVVIQAGDQHATADTGVYDMNSQTITLSGRQVVLNQGQNVFVGCRLTVHVATSEAKLDSCGKRVMIQLDPKSGDAAKK